MARKLHPIWLPILLCAVTACAIIEPPPPRTNIRDVVVDEALAQLDRPYRYAGAGPTAFDASGFTQFVYGKCGLELPHSATSQHAQGASIPFGKARRGDLLFYSLDEGPYQELHVGIYIGRARMVHIRVNGKVAIEVVDAPFWQRRLVDAVSYLP